MIIVSAPLPTSPRWGEEQITPGLRSLRGTVMTSQKNYAGILLAI
jgi:hypothetical protein